tara:strand:- start:2133 stop:2720 length:588 start_codon:yes stop_codon:yes gene_type:complete
MPKISDARRDARRAEILDAALRCFSRSGYQRTSMADIITESGLSAGAIYGYFASKQDLVLAVASRLLEERRADVESAAREHPLSPAEIALTLIHGVRTQMPMDVLLQIWAEASVDPGMRGLIESTLSHLRATVGESLLAWATTHPERIADPASWSTATAPVLLSLIPGFVLQRVLLDGFDEDAFLRAVPMLLPHD